MLSKGLLSFLLWVLTTCPCTGLPSSVGVPELGPRGACPGPPAGLGVLPLWEADLHWSAPANPSLLAWQPKDKASQKYLCGWRKVNSSASLFFPGNRGHRQIQQNRSRDRARRGSRGVSEGALPPHAHFCLLPSGSVMAWVAVAVAEGEERCSKGLESWHPAMRPAPIWLNPAIMPWGKRTRSTEGTCPRSHGQLGFSRILLALHESLRFCVTL